VARKDKGTGYALLGVLAGAAIGAALGLVYSRGSGEENRKAMLDWGQGRANDLQRKARSELQAVQHKAEDQIGQVRREAEHRLDTVRHTAEDRLDAVRHKVEDTASSVSSAAGSLVDRARGEAVEASERVEDTVERALPETPDSSRGLGQPGSPAL
jgi:gas vesicle protein